CWRSSGGSLVFLGNARGRKGTMRYTDVGHI
ncbi:hypothetical protein PSYMO_30123, partial [Pseudomonas amygdali pv. mori str. 301020]